MDDFEKYYNISLRFLSFRPRSEQEVRNHLKIKNQKSKIKTGISELTINQIITKLKNQNFLNDEEFAKWWVEQRTKFKPRAFRLIKLELKQKGVSDEIIEEIFNFQFSIFNEKENAKKLIEQKLPKYKHLTKEKIFQKLGSILLRKGFSYDIIKTSIDETLRKGV